MSSAIIFSFPFLVARTAPRASVTPVYFCAPNCKFQSPAGETCRSAALFNRSIFGSGQPEIDLYVLVKAIFYVGK